MTSFYAFFALLIGGAVATQAILNSALRGRTDLITTLFANAIPIILISTLWISTTKNAFSRLPGGGSAAPWWMYGGGILGTFIVAVSMVVLPKLGASWALLLIVLGQLLIGLLADHFGWLGLVQVPINKERILGTILVLVGCWLFNRSN